MRRSPALVQFSKDHHFALLLIWKVRQGLRFDIEAQRINNYINFFYENYLEEHFIKEEEVLFVHLTVDNAARIIAEKDHAALREIIKEIKVKQESNIKATDFINRLEKHIRFEERELFNELQNTLTESTLHNIAEKMEALPPHPKEDSWKDTFWLKNSIIEVKI